jgi:hypothetical protein
MEELIKEAIKKELDLLALFSTIVHKYRMLLTQPSILYDEIVSYLFRLTYLEISAYQFLKLVVNNLEKPMVSVQRVFK